MKRPNLPAAMTLGGVFGLLVYPVAAAVIRLTPYDLRAAPSGAVDLSFVQSVYSALIGLALTATAVVSIRTDIGPKSGVQAWGGKVVVVILSLVVFTFGVLFGTAIGHRILSSVEGAGG